MNHRIWTCCLFSFLTFNFQAQGENIELIDMRAVPLADAARLLSEASGLNVVASVEAGKSLVSIYLTEIEPRDAIEALCRSHNLWLRDDAKSNVIRIHTPEEYKRDLNSFQEELTQVFSLRFPNGNDLGRTIRDLYGNRVRMNQNNSQDDQTAEELEKRFQRFDVLDGRGQQLGSSSTNSTTGGTGGGRSNSLRSNNSSSASNGGFQNNASVLPPLLPVEGLNGEQVQSLESPASIERDAAVQQLIDDRVDIFVTVIQRLNKVIVRTSDARAMEQIKRLATSIDVPTPTVILEVKILRVRLDQGYRSAVDYLFDDGTTKVGFGSTATTAGDFSFRYSGPNLNARIQILEEKGQVRVVSTPTLMIANNEVSRLFIGEERPLNRSFNGGTIVPGAANNVVTSGSTDIEFRPVGTTLLITPNINADKTVTLRMLQENSNINVDGTSVLVPDNNGFSRKTVDTVQSRTVSGTVVAKNQIPVIIGGLIDNNFTDTRSQIPFLGNIPVVGTLFGKRQDTKTRDELVLLIRPHLVDPAEGGANATRQIMEANDVQAAELINSGKIMNDRLQKKFPPFSEPPLEALPPPARKKSILSNARRGLR